MAQEGTNPTDREISHAHFFHVFFPITFALLVFVDDQSEFSTILKVFIPDLARFLTGGIFLACALSLIIISNKILFGSNNAPPTHMIKTGILRHVRNPMYLGILLIFIAVIIMSVSLLGLLYFVGIFFFYDKMASYEEKKLETLFGKEYLEYQKQVPKWIPRFSLPKYT